MCFTPQVSILTAIIEFLLAVWIWLKFKRTLANKLIVIFIFLLGFYQFTEFMLCSSGDFDLWAKAGFIAYTFMPPVFLHFVCRYTDFDLKIKSWLLYLPAIISALIALLSPNFIEGGSCNKFFITVKSLLVYPYSNSGSSIIYVVYYFCYILFALYILGKKHQTETNKTKKKVYLLWSLAVILALVPPVILFIVAPSLGIMFPSIYCEFALLYAIIAYIGVSLDHKLVKE